MEPMPITFTNKKTGQVLKFNTPQEALDYGFSAEKVQAKIKANKILESTIATGNPEAYDIESKKALDKIGEVDKSTQNKQEAIAVANELLGRDTGAITGIPNIFKYLTGENQYTKNLLEQLTAKLSVDAREKLKGSGQISDYEAKLLQKSVSALRTNLSNKDFQRELTKVRDILAGTYEEGDLPSEVSTDYKKVAPAIGALLGGAGGALVGGPLGAAGGAFAGGAGVGAAQNALLDLLGKQNETPLQQVGNVTKDATIEGAIAGVTGGAGKLLGKTPSFLKNILNPTGALGEARVAAGAGYEGAGKVLANDNILKGVIQKINQSSISSAKKKVATEIAENSFARGGTTEILESIGKFTEAKGYTAGGNALRTAEGQYAVALRNTLKEIWQKEAPEVLKITGQMKNVLGLGKGVSKSLRNVGSVAGGVGGLLYLQSLLRGKQYPNQ